MGRKNGQAHSYFIYDHIDLEMKDQSIILSTCDRRLAMVALHILGDRYYIYDRAERMCYHIDKYGTTHVSECDSLTITKDEKNVEN